ncbi:hypothetical protein E0H92_23940 [Kribbella speibonae]|uniref:Uncharacterized protein n=1 Tax=Kribbella speibonae TaxID=1572660 RepID=A0A4R0IPU6_9ACTN|nr:hypothetical protein E0H92_23940 [Kribbella speibonae]
MSRWRIRLSTSCGDWPGRTCIGGTPSGSAVCSRMRTRAPPVRSRSGCARRSRWAPISTSVRRPRATRTRSRPPVT